MKRHFPISCECWPSGPAASGRASLSRIHAEPHLRAQARATHGGRASFAGGVSPGTQAGAQESGGKCEHCPSLVTQSQPLQRPGERPSLQTVSGSSERLGVCPQWPSLEAAEA